MSTSSGKVPGGQWQYSPSFALAVVAVILYGLVSIGFLGRMARHKGWFMTALLLGTIMETLGFGARSANVKNLSNATLYKMQIACTILAPVFTAAAEYILLGRIMDFVGRRFSLLRPSLISWIFIISDVISLLIQICGAAAILARPVITPTSTIDQINHAANLLKTGDNVLLAGLGINLGSFVIFTIQVLYFDYRTRSGPAPPGRWRVLLYALYASSILVLLRQLFRVTEFSEGWNGYLNTHEGYFYGLDALPILIANGIYVVVWPTLYIPEAKNVRLREDGEQYVELTEREKQRAAPALP